MSDSNCIVEQANKIVKKYYKGDSQMGLIPIDPLKVDCKHKLSYKKIIKFYLNVD